MAGAEGHFHAAVEMAPGEYRDMEGWYWAWLVAAYSTGWAMSTLLPAFLWAPGRMAVATKQGLSARGMPVEWMQNLYLRRITPMWNETIEARAHTTRDGVLNLSVNVGVADADVAVSVRVMPLTPAGEVDVNGWPQGFFDRVAGSMPDLERAPQGRFEQRLTLG